MLQRNLSLTILLGLALSVAGVPGTVSAGQLTPGDVTTENWTITSSNPLINQAGTYNIRTSSGAINVTADTANGRGAGLIRAAGSGSTAGDITVNGDINFTSRDVLSHYLITGDGGDTITVNGNFTADIYNTTQLNVPPEWAPRGVQIMEYRPAGTKIVFNGDFTFNVYNDMDPNGQEDSYTVVAVMAPDTEIDLNGNVTIVNTLDNFDKGYGGANALYAEHDSVLNVTGDKVILRTIGWRPHAISAKDGAVVNINANTLQVVGVIDMTEDTNPSAAVGGTLNAVFSGSDSYWYGDEINVNGDGNLNVTFKDGAVYMPFGTIKDVGYEVDGVYYPSNQYNAKKFLSSLTLETGGIVDLFDEDAQARWDELGLDTRYTALKQAKLDYLMIEDLKGSDGTFRLDMNDLDKAHTDMIYVLSSTEGAGQHNVEAYNDNNFGNISADNTLRFATVAASAADKLIFKDKMNIYGNTLWDYNVLIGHSPYDVNDPENAIYNGSRDGLTADQINELMAGGMNWYIYSLTRTPSDHARVVMDGVDAGYDLATQLDRYNKRHGEAQFLDPASPVWVRMQRGDMGRDGGYDGRYTMGQLGAEFGKDDNHYGLALDYMDATSSPTRHNGNIDTNRKGILLYDTLTWKDGSYLDLTARYGKLNNDVHGYNHTGARLNGDYTQHFWSLGAEYGKKMQAAGRSFFWEPQAQLQYTRLQGTSFTTDTDFATHIDDANSLIGRLGFRVGSDIRNKGSVYFKADILREFTGGADYAIRAGNVFLQDEAEQRGTWYDVGVGADLRLSRYASLTCDFERSFGGELGKNWEANLGFKCAF
jgi:outer membrane autotransporter protein